MTVGPSTRIGPYEINTLLGAGGMGEVYRARDTGLGRDVAVKVLPGAFAQNAECMARLQREAHILASLNHANIATIYGLEESGGTRVLIMELVEGPTLADRIAKGPIPIEEALPIAEQITEALEYAHEKGVVHRDLKPANVKVTSTGVVKVLDFGLAKVVENTSPLPRGPSNSPTLTIEATRDGLIVGTAAYMSPEQARGSTVDKRADVWAFGAVLFEMLTGRRAFEGRTTSDVLASVLHFEPEWTALPSSMPPSIVRLLRRCLAKDRRQRLQAIGEARIAIEEYLSHPESTSEAHSPQTTAPGALSQRERLTWALVGLVVGSLSVAAVRYLKHMPVAEAPTIRASILAPPGSAFRFLGYESGFALSPDGRRLAYIGSVEGRTALWVRSVDAASGQLLPGTEQATSPFWSPDSKFIGFFTKDKLKKVEATGGLPLTICDASDARGGTWNRAGDVLFGSHVDKPVYRVPAAGGLPVAVTRLDAARKERSHQWPYFLPDGRHFLYLGGDPYAPPESGINRIFVASLDSTDSRLLVKADSGAAYASGYLLFLRGTTLVAQQLDPKRLEMRGAAFPVAEQVQLDDFRLSGLFSASESGLLAYAESSQGTGLQFEWFDRGGKRLGAIPDKSAYCCPQLSPDGSMVVYDNESGGKRDVWAYDFRRGTKTRLTFGTQNAGTEVWSPDGRHILFSSNRNGQFGLYQKAADGSGGEETILPATEGAKFPWSWSRDGKFVAFLQLSPTIGAHLWLLPFTADRKPYRFTQSEFVEHGGAFSPDGKWVAYSSDETGQLEVYAASFLDPGSRYQVSTGGGLSAVWRRDGKEILFISFDHKMMAAEVTEKGGSLQIGSVRALFKVDDYFLPPIFDVTADGRQFIINTFDEQSSPPITLVSNWLHKE